MSCPPFHTVDLCLGLAFATRLSRTVPCIQMTRTAKKAARRLRLGGFLWSRWFANDRSGDTYGNSPRLVRPTVPC
jgi:hypothetical protein